MNKKNKDKEDVGLEKVNKEIKKEFLEKTGKTEEEKKTLEDYDPLKLFDNLISKPDVSQEKDKIIDILFNNEDLRKISDVTPNELKDIVVLLTFAKHIKTPLINYFADCFLALSLSKDRQSRKEVVEIYKNDIYNQLGIMPSMSEETPSRMGRLKERLNL